MASFSTTASVLSLESARTRGPAPNRPAGRHAPRDRERIARQARRLAHVLDSSIVVPGTSWRIGADALAGLIPGVGDALCALASLWIVWCAIRLGVPRRVIARMLLNVAIDALAGSIPIVGDLFDAGFKANTRNIRLMGLTPVDDAGR